MNKETITAIRDLDKYTYIAGADIQELCDFALKAIEALQYIVNHEWVAGEEPYSTEGKWLNEFVAVAKEPLALLEREK